MKQDGNRRMKQTAAAVLFLIFCAPAMARAEERPVALVNGAAISSRELEEAVDQLIPRAVFHGTVSPETRAEFRERALDDLIVKELQFQDARVKGIKPDKQFVKREMERVRDQFPSKSEYRKALEQSGLTEDALRARFEKESLVREVVARTVTGPSRMSDAGLKEYYDQNVSKFKKPETARVRIISVRDEKKAKEAFARVKAGEDFGNVAARMSEDNYRIKGGDIGFIHRGRIFPALEDAAFRLKPGEVSDLILTEGSWFIVKAEEQEPGRQIPFEEAKDKLRQDLEKKRSKELNDEWMSTLRSKSKIEITSPPAPVSK